MKHQAAGTQSSMTSAAEWICFKLFAERERERDVYVYIYIYIYIHTESTCPHLPVISLGIRGPEFPCIPAVITRLKLLAEPQMLNPKPSSLNPEP